jgi:hypothetical protein
MMMAASVKSKRNRMIQGESALSFALRWLGLIATLLILVVTHASVARGEDVRVIAVPVKDSSFRGFFEKLEVGDVESGEKVVRCIRIENHSTKSLELLSVIKSCGCLKVDLPDNRIAKSGEVVELTVEVDVERYSKNLTQVFQIRVESKGARDSLTFQLEMNLVKHISFATPHYYLRYAKRSGRKTFLVPVSISSDMRWQDFEPRIDDGIKSFVDAKLVEQTGDVFVECSLNVDKISVDSGLLTLVKKSDSKPVSECLLSFSKQDWFTVLPSTLTFVPVKIPGDTLREANGIVRMQTETNDLGELRELRCETSKGVRLPCEFKKVRDGFYRIVISTIEKEDLESNDTLKISAATPNGRIEVFVQGRLSN